jgi:hypothetical protein
MDAVVAPVRAPLVRERPERPRAAGELPDAPLVVERLERPRAADDPPRAPRIVDLLERPRTADELPCVGLVVERPRRPREDADELLGSMLAGWLLACVDDRKRARVLPAQGTMRIKERERKFLDITRGASDPAVHGWVPSERGGKSRKTRAEFYSSRDLRTPPDTAKRG